MSCTLFIAFPRLICTATCIHVLAVARMRRYRTRRQSDKQHQRCQDSEPRLNGRRRCSRLCKSILSGRTGSFLRRRGCHCRLHILCSNKKISISIPPCHILVYRTPDPSLAKSISRTPDQDQVLPLHQGLMPLISHIHNSVTPRQALSTRECDGGICITTRHVPVTLEGSTSAEPAECVPAAVQGDWPRSVPE